MSIKNKFKRFLRNLNRPIEGKRIAFSQEGEDLILESFFFKEITGFYVDIGAYHPTRYSNTHYFYLKGWRGINIDAVSSVIDEFRRQRPRDINVTAAVGDTAEAKELNIFSEGARNTLSADFANRILKEIKDKIIRVELVKTIPLETLLDKYLPAGQKINFLSVDVEGMDLEVLQSNNWRKYRPEIVLAEFHGNNLDFTTIMEANNSPIADYLNNLSYEMVAKTARTMIYRDKYLNGV